MDRHISPDGERAAYTHRPPSTSSTLPVRKEASCGGQKQRRIGDIVNGGEAAEGHGGFELGAQFGRITAP
jgi:hypothetical protein